MIFCLCSSLWRRKDSRSRLCALCQEEEETVFHLFISCQFAKQVWMASDLGWYTPNVSNFIAWLEKLFNLFNQQDQALALHILWMIWGARNAKVWQAVQPTPVGTWLKAKRNFDDWWLMAKPQLTTDLQSSGRRMWVPPQLGFIKVNVDASTGLVDGVVGMGFIARNDVGGFMAAKNMTIRCNCGPREAEALSVKEALSWIKSRGWTHMEVETDCKDVADGLNNSSQDWSYFSSIIDACKTLVVSCRGVFYFQFVYRSANEAAHVLARASHSSQSLGEWVHLPPDFIVPLI
ncbi:unnamed protein product [Cuscuta campestris]|uniref:RNase H type-1 domain-containing protein n=1 Tax=Cuscuta campestris TaxID=132261 RepID=A0A484N1K7_9ASTE|nr:unnamed protein product [Cuscuta campestris]